MSKQPIQPDEELLRAFRKKIKNPLNWRKTSKIIRSYDQKQLQNYEAVKDMITRLSSELQIALTPKQRASLTKWILSEKINPESPEDQKRMRDMILG